MVLFYDQNIAPIHTQHSNIICGLKFRVNLRVHKRKILH